MFGCKQEDITPSWLKINEFELITNETSQGPNSHAITDVWVFIDGQALGVFELPAKLPVLDEGEHDFVIFPGIKNNGISATKIRYPFYKTFDITETLVKNDTLELFPVTSYKENVEVAYLEDFEDAGISLLKGPSSDTDIVFVNKDDFPELVVYGDKCGRIQLGNMDSLYTGITNDMMNLPKAQDVALEIDYRNNNSLAMGVLARFPDGSTNQHNPLVIMNPQERGKEVWKKIYIDLKEDISFEITATDFEIYFLGVLDEGNPDADIYIDNIKVVHF